jgi:hypothetical protein
MVGLVEEEEMAEMRLIEETPSKLVLAEKDTSQDAGRFLRRLIIILLVALILGCLNLVTWVGYRDGSLSWMFWLWVIGILIMDVLTVAGVVFSIWVFMTTVIEATVTIDLHSQRAVRIEKLRFGKTKQYELRLEQVSRVKIHDEEAGKATYLLLESTNNVPFTVSANVPFVDIESRGLGALGLKLGEFLKKPVVKKYTDQGNLLSEETIQF